MNKSKNKFYKKKRVQFLALTIILLAFANSCMTMRMSDKKVMRTFKKNGQAPQIYHDTFKGKPIRYIADKPFNKLLPTIIFVHGAPGSSDNFYKHLQDTTFQKKANLVSVDRLGYGYSNFGIAEVSIKKQAQMIAYIAKKYEQTKIVLVAWSYGGAIIAKMAMDNPKIDHLVMIAPALSPKDEKYFWFGNFAKWKATRWIAPKTFQVAEDEKLAHANELKKIEKNWFKIKAHISYFHGNDDGLVPYKNMNYLKSKVNDSLVNYFTIDKGSHFIIFKNYDLIRDEILKVLEKIKMDY